jgi:hypothetical protein
MLDLVTDFKAAILLSRIESALEQVLPLVPDKIAQMESMVATLPADARETVEHLIKVEKIILFCATELKALDQSKSETVKRCLAKGMVQVFKKEPASP